MKKLNNKFKLGLLPLTIATILSGQVIAAENNETTINDDRKIEVISVTAQKRTQNLQQVPVAVTSISAEDIEKFGFSSASDIQFQTPGLIVSYASTSAIPNFSIRGIGLNDFTAVQSSPVAIHVDDVYLGSSTMLNFALFDIESVEVLKGPQGTLYGRNATGGAVNFATRKPTQDLEYGVSVNLANYESITTEGYISGGLTDTLSARVSLHSTEQKSGPFTHPVYGDVGKKSKVAGRFQLLWEPSDDFDARFVVYGGKDDSDGNQYQGFGALDGTGTCKLASDADFSFANQQQCKFGDDTNGNPVVSADDDPYTLQSGIINRDEIDVLGTSLAMNYEFSDILFTSITAYAKADRVSQEDADGSILRLVDVGYETQYKQLSEELRLTSLAKQKLEWTVGLYVSTDELYTPLTETDQTEWAVFNYRENHTYQLDTDSIALFTQNEYHINDKLSLVAGLRYTHETRAFKGGTYDLLESDGHFGGGPNSNGDFVPGPKPLPNLDDESSFDAVAAYTNQEITFDKWSWRLGANYQINEDMFTYVSVANGFKSGGFIGDITTQPAIEDPYDEETLTAYEVGFKADLFDYTVRWNSALFYYDYQDVILALSVEQPGGNSIFTNDNVSDADVYGIETDITWVPAENWELRLGGTLLETEQKQLVTVDLPIEGSDLPNAPKFSANYSVRYETELSENFVAFFQVDGTTRSKYYARAHSTPLTELEGYSLFNASVVIASNTDDWQVTLWAKNLTDETYYTYMNDLSWAGSIIKTPGTPRTYGIKFAYSF